MTARQAEKRAGYLFMLPWVIGFFVFMVYPVVASVYYSFCEYSVLKPPIYVGLDNYVDLMRDAKFWISLKNTLFFSVISVPLGTVVAIGLAILLNAKVKGQVFYRTAFYIPSLVPQVALAMLWLWILNPDHGILNNLIEHIPYVVVQHWWPFHAVVGHLSGPAWMTDTNWSKPALIIMTIWTGGNAMVIYLAGLQEVPAELLEACDLDGGKPLDKLRHVTIPLISPIIMFNVVMAIIGAFQTFVGPYIMFPGGAPDLSTYFYVSYLFDNAMVYHKMGYACAMGWIMFVFIFVLTLVSVKISEKKVYYAGG